MITGLLKNNGYRYERKFMVSELTRQAVVSIVRIHPYFFSEIYHRRFVNNIYFDSISMRDYRDAVEGNAHRKKVRIRWYGKMFGPIEKPVLEFKIKKGMLGAKTSFVLEPFSIDNSLRFDSIWKSISASSIPDAVKTYLRNLEPVLLNRYTRAYFQSADKDFRVTIDSDLEYYRVNPFNRVKDTSTVILELKYSQHTDEEAHNVASYFPFRLSKSSKYTNGIDRLSLN